MLNPMLAQRMRASALSLALCALASNAHAIQQRGQYSVTMASTADAGCAELRWHADWLSWFPRIADSCRDVVQVRGQRWARVQAIFIRHRDDGAFVSQLLDDKDNLLGGITLLPAAGQGVSLRGRRYWFADVVGEHVLHFYVPEGELAVASQPGAPPEQHALILRPGATLNPTAAVSNGDPQAIGSNDGLGLIKANAVGPLGQLRRSEMSPSAALAAAVASIAIALGATSLLRRQLSTRVMIKGQKRRYFRSNHSPT